MEETKTTAAEAEAAAAEAAAEKSDKKKAKKQDAEIADLKKQLQEKTGQLYIYHSQV